VELFWFVMDAESLEGAINDAKAEGVSNEESGVSDGKVSLDSEIGFHKGALNVLVAERNELVKMLQNVEGIAGAHVKRLKELGVDVK
jgi:hypothetical protein